MAFAAITDVEQRWRPLSISEQVTADALLIDAEDIIRARWGDIDSRLTSGALTAATLRRVTCGMVKRAMLNTVTEGVTQQAQGAGPFNVSQTFANPNGNLYLSADDIKTLDGHGFHGRVRTAWLA